MRLEDPSEPGLRRRLEIQKVPTLSLSRSLRWGVNVAPRNDLPLPRASGFVCARADRPGVGLPDVTCGRMLSWWERLARAGAHVMRPQVALNTFCTRRVHPEAANKEAICLLGLLVRGSRPSGHMMGIHVQLHLLWRPQGGSVVSKVVMTCRSFKNEGFPKFGCHRV